MDIQTQIHKAKKPIEEALRQLRGAGHGEIARTVREVFRMELAHLIEGNEKNPVHHTAHVANFMTEILLGEGATADQIKHGVFAALLHDIGLARTGEGKIRKADLQKDIDSAKDWEGVSKVVTEAVQSRKSHMKLGSEIARSVLIGYNDWTGKPFFDPQKDIPEICRLIAIHDDPSICEYERMSLQWLKNHATASGPSKKPDPRQWLIKKDDFLMKCLREADRVWMVSPDGVAVDLERDSAKAQEAVRNAKQPIQKASADPAGRINGNVQRHREEMQLYKQEFGRVKLAAYGFKNGFLYRTTTGYAIFRRLIAEVQALYQVNVVL